MILYNVTSNISDEVVTQWLDWMNTIHIPAMLSTGKFFNARMVKVLVEEEMGGQTYSVQYYTNTKELLERYYLEDADRMRRHIQNKFANNVLEFATELEVVGEY